MLDHFAVHGFGYRDRAGVLQQCKARGCVEMEQRAGVRHDVSHSTASFSGAVISVGKGRLGFLTLRPIDQVQKFLGHLHLSTTQIYAETSLRTLGDNYMRALGGKR